MLNPENGRIAKALNKILFTGNRQEIISFACFFMI